MQQSSKALVIAILLAGGLIAAAILYTQAKPAKTETPDPFRELKAAVAAQMRDPESATFQALVGEDSGLFVLRRGQFKEFNGWLCRIQKVLCVKGRFRRLDSRN